MNNHESVNQPSSEIRHERNYGIDLLRVVSMLMVTILHLSGHGGFQGTPENGAVFYILSAFIVLCYGAVDIFALISGFVMYGTRVKYSRLISLWFQVFFYSAGLSIYERVMYNITPLYPAFFPVLSSKFWYFSAYFFMFFFIPSFNELIGRFSKKSAARFLAAGFFILCILSNIHKFLGTDDIGIQSGYNTVWISYCYLVGAYIKKYQPDFEKISSQKYILAIIICNIITYTDSTLLYKLHPLTGMNLPPSQLLITYTSPTVFIPSICMLMLFGRIKITRGKSIVKFFAATSFSVYIIQNHSYIWFNFITKFSTFFNNPTAAEKIGLVLGFSVAFYLAASLVDFLRIQLFRLLHIDFLSQKICELLGKLFNKTIKKRTEENGLDN